jgi:hypothetical protein
MDNVELIIDFIYSLHADSEKMSVSRFFYYTW